MMYSTVLAALSRTNGLQGAEVGETGEAGRRVDRIDGEERLDRRHGRRVEGERSDEQDERREQDVGQEATVPARSLPAGLADLVAHPAMPPRRPQAMIFVALVVAPAGTGTPTGSP
jgi:hypothetical protein